MRNLSLIPSAVLVATTVMLAAACSTGAPRSTATGPEPDAKASADVDPDPCQIYISMRTAPMDPAAVRRLEAACETFKQQQDATRTR